jgi:hypothetical protein
MNVQNRPPRTLRGLLRLPVQPLLRALDGALKVSATREPSFESEAAAERREMMRIRRIAELNLWMKRERAKQ